MYALKFNRFLNVGPANLTISFDIKENLSVFSKKKLVVFI